VLELHLLDPANCPEEAVRASRAAYDTLAVLLSEVEDKRNKGMLSPNAQDHYTLIVQSDPVFSNIPDPKNTPFPKVTRDQIGTVKHVLK